MDGPICVRPICVPAPFVFLDRWMAPFVFQPRQTHRSVWNLIVPTGLRLGWNLALPKMQNNTRRNRNRPLTRCRSQVTSPGGASSCSIRVDLCLSMVSTSATSIKSIRLELHRPDRLAARVEPRPPKMRDSNRKNRNRPLTSCRSQVCGKGETSRSRNSGTGPVQLSFCM